MKNSDSILKNFNSEYTLLCNRLKTGDMDVLEPLNALCEQYKPALGDTHESIISCEITHAQLNAKLGEMTKARTLYHSLISKIKARYSTNKDYKINILIEYIFFLISVGENRAAISEIEELRALLKDDIEPNDERYVSLLYLLARIYTVENKHRKSVDIRCEILDRLMEEHNSKYGNFLMADNITFSENILDEIISLHLNIGGLLIFLKDFKEAKRYLEQGYFIAFIRYGDKDEKTFKLNFNLATLQLYTNPLEGVRQLQFVYKDMLQYLGHDNKYTRKAYSLLDSLGEKPGEFRGLNVNAESL